MYDTTLRDGAQGPGVKFSAEDQLQVVRELDALGIAYIEGGQPGSNPKAVELFQRTRDMDLPHAKMAAFGSTRHPRTTVEDDPNLQALLSAATEVVTIFAKTSPLHAQEILQVTLDENLKLVEESVRYLRAHGRRVFLDAEHFFDGYFEDPEYALAVLHCGWEAGAEVLVLCETNGGRLPHEVATATRAVRQRLAQAQIGIHTHNDSGCAVANSLAAVIEGATQVQGTMNGYGERTGNVDLCSVIPNLQLKMGHSVLSEQQLGRLTQASHVIAELANISPRDFQPFVGRDAFTHKGGMHADAVRKLKASYEHIDPGLIGNRTHIAVSEVSGRSSLMQKAAEFGIELGRERPETREILERVKDLEKEGYEFEGADASLELIMRKAMGQFEPFFVARGFHAHVDSAAGSETAQSEATVKIEMPDGSVQHTVAEGHGPVDALNNALRKALEEVYPEVWDVHLEDYKVRILDGKLATRAKTRVLIESSDASASWNTVGVSENIIAASFVALLDSIEYKLMKSREKQSVPEATAKTVVARSSSARLTGAQTPGRA
ncbi:MAG: citramalate synthase [Candidatus Hydrogenedentes bacterium]|nr:citramalate synthase [Candidatus Hydrogenedentota bacterium]